MTVTTTAASTKVITGEVRASYVNVFAPRLNELSDKLEYSMMILIPKTDQVTIDKIRAACKVAAHKKWGAKIDVRLRNPLRDGDDPAALPQGGSNIPSTYAGHYFANIKSPTKPGIVNAQLHAVTDDKEFVSGDYCRVSLNAYAYANKVNNGVSLGLVNIQVLRKGEPLGSMSRAEDDFAAFGGAVTSGNTSSTNDDDDIPW
jgi:hypothetical protein